MDKILIVDDEQTIRKLLKDLLDQKDREIITAESGSQALDFIESQSFDLVLADIHMPDMDGFELIRHTHKQNSSIPIIMITAYASTDSAVNALRAGAYDYICKPFINEELCRIVNNALRAQHLFHQVNELKGRISEQYSLSQIIGQCPSMQHIFQLIMQVSRTDCNVLITGESGTGKELVAQAIHENSPRCENSFVPINCASIPLGLLESELFGHVKGAFTGAYREKVGLIQSASGGTLFLDEIGDMPMELQAKLLRVIQDRKIQKVGGTSSESVDIRIITATHHNLNSHVREKAFRKDLYYRLNVIEISLPPLREREGDTALLSSHFLKLFSQKCEKMIQGFSPEALRILNRYPWPGNIRELENTIEHAVILCNGNMIQEEHLPPKLIVDEDTVTLSTAPLDVQVGKYEKKCILQALTRCGYDVSSAAEKLNVSQATLYRKIKKHSIPTQRAIHELPAKETQAVSQFRK